MRPGPTRPCAISKPLPSPSKMFDAGTRTFSKVTSPCPCGAWLYPNTLNKRSIFTPGASSGTRIIDCCLCGGAEGSVLPMKIAILQRGSPAPDVHHYVINGRKGWTSGAGDPRCKIAIFMGKTDPSAPPHKQQSMILVPMDAPGVKIERLLRVFGYDHAPHGHGEVTFENVRIPASNVLLGEGRGFEIPHRRLSPTPIH